MFGRATIRLGIGPHSSFKYNAQAAARPKKKEKAAAAAPCARSPESVTVKDVLPWIHS